MVPGLLLGNTLDFLLLRIGYLLSLCGLSHQVHLCLEGGNRAIRWSGSRASFTFVLEPAGWNSAMKVFRHFFVS
jgi:hypothetical protein